MGRFLTGVLLFALALLLGFASAPTYEMLLTVALVASAGAVYFFWAAGRGRTLRLRVATWAGVLLATLNALQAVFGLASLFLR